MFAKCPARRIIAQGAPSLCHHPTETREIRPARLTPFLCRGVTTADIGCKRGHVLGNPSHSPAVPVPMRVAAVFEACRERPFRLSPREKPLCHHSRQNSPGPLAIAACPIRHRHTMRPVQLFPAESERAIMRQHVLEECLGLPEPPSFAQTSPRVPLARTCGTRASGARAFALPQTATPRAASSSPCAGRFHTSPLGCDSSKTTPDVFLRSVFHSAGKPW